jgi:hypothetical protein
VDRLTLASLIIVVVVPLLVAYFSWRRGRKDDGSEQ